MRLRTIFYCLGAWATISAVGAAAPPERADVVPPSWKAVTIHWHPTWAKTLEANPVESWQEAIAADKSLAAATTQVLALRRIELLKAMLARFKSPEDARVEAYREIAASYAKLGDSWRRTWWLWKLGQDFPHRKDLLSEACLAVADMPLESSRVRPSLQPWAPVLDQVLSLAAEGKIAYDDPAVAAACRRLALLLAAQRRYDRIPAFLQQVTTLGAQSRAALGAGGDLLAWFGHTQAAAGWYLQAGQDARHGQDATTELIWGLDRNAELQARWDAIAQGRDAKIVRTLEPGDVQSLLLAAAKGRGFLRADGRRFLSPWTAVAAAFQALSDEQVMQLQRSQDAAAGYRAKAATDWDDRRELLGLLRQYPWSRAVHVSLMSMAELALRHGQPCWAAAAYSDVLRFSRDEALAAEARVGLWMAQAQDPRQRDDVRQQITTLPTGMTLFWSGQPVAPAQFARVLLGPDDVSPLTPQARGLLGVSGTDRVVEPAPIRYRLDNTPRKEALTAEEAATGKPLWTTAGRKDLAGLRFWGPPATAHGRVIAMTLTAAVRGVEPLAALLCFNERNGRLIWRRPLGQGTAAAEILGRPAGGLTIHQGKVYCATGLGLIARCDLRDGLIEWVSAYGSAVWSADTAAQRSRRGEGPLVVGRTVLAAPRDHSGIVAIERDSGKRLWQTPMVPSDRLVGVVRGAVIGIDQHGLTAVDVRSGRRLWHRRFDHATGCRAAVLGDSILVAAGRKLYRIAAGTGVDLAVKPLPATADARWVFGTTAAAANLLMPIPPAPQHAPTAPPLRLPLVQVLRVNIPRPQAAFATGPSGPAGAFCIVAGNRIGYVRTAPTVAMVWQREVAGAPPAVHLIGDRVFLAQGRELSALAPADGALQWSVQLPFSPEILEGDGRLLLATTGATKQEPFAAAIDPATGTLRWARSLNEPACFNVSQGIKGAVVRPTGGAAQLGVYMLALSGKDGWRGSEVVLGEADGAVREIRPMPITGWWPNMTVIAADWIATIGPDQQTCVLGRDGRPSPGASWRHGWSPGVSGNYRGYYRMFKTDSGPYYRLGKRLYHWNIAAGKQVLYDLPALDWGNYRVVDLREQGPEILLLSIVRNRIVHRSQRHLQGPKRNSQIFIDSFERASGKHLKRFEFAGVSDDDTSWYRYKPVAKILPAAVIVSDATSLRVYVTDTRHSISATLPGRGT